ncbi:MAG: tripartite tricarboxylate transporter substrate binding protein [Burkholderiales bacterium]|nr:tripartite tricarboxylate transporter substrate binding protein [Burkholderiales bacterium]
MKSRFFTFRFFAFITPLLLVPGLLLPAPSATAQTYPNKPLRFVVSFTPGGSQDVVARLFGQKVGEALGQQVVIENRSGAGGLISAQIVARSNPDGHTLFLSNGAPLAIIPNLQPNVDYHPLKDFTHIIHLIDLPMVVLVNAKLPATSIKELIAYSKANKGRINTASTGNGTYTHLTLELFKIATGASLTHVPYKGAAPAFTDLLGGQIESMFTTTASAQPHLASGRVRVLAVTTPKRASLMPNVPTMTESGFPGFEVSSWAGVSAPAGIPAAVSKRLAVEFGKAMELPDTKARLAGLGVEPSGATHEVFTKMIRDESERWAKVIKTAEIRP